MQYEDLKRHEKAIALQEERLDDVKKSRHRLWSRPSRACIMVFMLNMDMTTLIKTK